MRWADRKTRIAVALAIAVVGAVVVWRTATVPGSGRAPCEPGRIEQKDAAGKVVKITRTTCG